MSASSCDVNCTRSPNSDDFCCTEQELFDSFMEIVNDPELQALGENETSSKGNVLEGVKNKDSEMEEGTSSSLPEDISAGNMKHLSQFDSENTTNTVKAETAMLSQNNCAEMSDVLDQDCSDNGGKNSLTNGDELSDVVEETSSDIKSNVDPSNSEESMNNEDKETKLLNDNQDSSVDTIAQNCKSLDEKPHTTQQTYDQDLPLTDNEKSLPANNTQPTNPEEPVSLDSNSHENEINQHEKESPTSVQEPTDQSELQIIESNIEEGIRKANKVCEEINAIMQRLSQSSDELLDDNDTDPRSILANIKSHETAAAPGPEVSENAESSKNNNIVEPQAEVESKEGKNDETDGSPTNAASDDGGGEMKTGKKRPNSLPKLMVTGQDTSSSPKQATASPSDATPSPLNDPATSPLGISPSQIIHLNDSPHGRKPSVSDSFDSSEGTGSSTGTPPTEARGPINWDVLNSAFDQTDTDEDEGVYEASGSYGGFGLVLDEDSVDTLSVNDSRYRSISQSSTVSETEFQEQYKKKHSTSSLERQNDSVLCSGYLFKLGGTGITPKNWRKRWCILRHDRCLYYYKGPRDKIPCGIIVLANYLVSHSSECNRKNCIKISKGGGRTYFFSSETPRDMLRWMESLRKAAENDEEGTSFVIRQEIIHNVAIPALSIKKPDCHGYLTKQGGKTTRSWKRRYCVLKNGCLYYYREMADTTALGVAKLHGYTVEETGRRSGFRCVPPHSGMRTFTFVADNEYDKKRWIPCFQESIRASTST